MSPIGGPRKRLFSNTNQTIAVRMKKPTVMYSAQSFGGWIPITKIKSIDMIERIANSVYPARPMFHGPILSHFGVPQASRPSVMGKVKERNKKMTVQETTMV